MVAAEYIDYDPASRHFIMTPTVLNTPKLMEAFLDYTNFLVDELLRAVPGLTERLSRGIHVADVGCGWGASTVTMAAAFPRSRFLGIEPDAGSGERARRLAAERRVHNVFWLAAPPHQLAPLPTHDLICAFDCAHDMVDARATLRATLHAIHEALADDGVYLWSEPNASDNPLENRHPEGNAFACVSPLHCLTVSLAEDGEGLGTVIGERGVRELAKEAGFSSIDKLPIANPFNQFFALRK
jgi:SAM-dependent methyltransferase